MSWLPCFLFLNCKNQVRGWRANSMFINYYLVGGFNPSEKYDFVSWDDDIPFSEWQVIKVMFQTTNQWLLTIINHY